jgi:Secretion system C-terminal sorting domain
MKNLNHCFFTFFILLAYSFLSAQDLKWIQKIGGTTAEFGNAVSIYNTQNIYDVTSFMGTVSVTSSMGFTSRGAEDILIRKSSSLGVLQWVKQIGGTKQDIAYDVATSEGDHVYIVGTFRDSLYLDSDLILEGNPDKTTSFLLKLNGIGDLIWVRKFDSDMGIEAKSMATAGDGQVIISGNFEGKASFSVDHSLTSVGGNDIFILKINDITGEIIFLRQIGSNEHEYANQISVDIQHNIYVTGDFRSSLDFDPGPDISAFNTKGLTDIFLLKLSTSGLYQWAKTFGSTGLDFGQSIINDAQRNVIITGRFSDNISFGDGISMLQSKGSTDIFLAKLDENGRTLWANSYGNTANDQGNQVIVNGTGVIYLAGVFRGKVDFDPSFAYNNHSESKGGADAFIAVYNQDGTYNDHISFGGIANEQMNGIALKSNGEIVSTGGFGAIVDFAPGSAEANVFANGGSDAFLLNLFICVNPYLKEVSASKPQNCLGEKALILIREGYLNSATQWSWQRESCGNVTFASGDFINVSVTENTSFYVKGSGGCVVNDLCAKVDVEIFTDSLKMLFFNFCDGDSVQVGNKFYKKSGIYSDTLKSKSGCDSVVISEISVFPKYRRAQAFDICPGQSIRVGNSSYSLSGIYTNIFSTINGCDSVIVTTIRVLPSIIDNVEATLCQGETITIGNVTYGSPGTYIQSSVGGNGCEDVLIVKINVLRVNFEQFVHLCDGDSLVVGNKVYKISGNYIDTLEAASGCDSIISSQIRILSPSGFVGDFIFCEGDSVVVGANVYKTRGIFIDTLINTAGCDSVVFTYIRMYDSPTKLVQNLRICEGDSVLVGNNIYRTSGVYKDTFQSIYGCDSTIVTNLHVASKVYFAQSEICRGDTVTIGDSILYDTGLYNIRLKNAYGCDSTIVYNLKVKENIARNFAYSICPGDSVRVGVRIYRQPGIYIDTLLASNGCDSTVTSSIRWNHASYDISYSICTGDSVIINEKVYRNQGIYVDTLVKSDGCFSILTIKIGVLPLYENDVIFEICKGESVTVGSATYFNAGKYTDILQSVNGCDSLVNFEIKIINFVPVFFASKDTLKAFKIPGAEYQWFECLAGERVQYLGANQPEFPLFKSGTFSLSIDYKGCTYFSDCLDFIRSSTDEQNKNEMVVYPNPFLGSLELHAPQAGIVIFRDISGKEAYRTSVNIGNNRVDCSNLQAGIYVLSLQYGETRQQIKLIKM